MRSPEAYRWFYEEFEHCVSSGAGDFDIDDEMGGADVTEVSR